MFGTALFPYEHEEKVFMLVGIFLVLFGGLLGVVLGVWFILMSKHKEPANTHSKGSHVQ